MLQVYEELLVPAKTLNKIISKIPVIGNIIIPKEVGEGLFGISFKIKGPPGAVKTTINPIRTITPRFIQKILEKKRNKKIKLFLQYNVSFYHMKFLIYFF